MLVQYFWYLLRQSYYFTFSFFVVFFTVFFSTVLVVFAFAVIFFDGDFLEINAKKVKVTGKKETQKVYNRHSMYPGGFKSETLQELRARKPEDIIKHAIKGMLPDNKLRASMMTRLYIFEGETHKYQDKFITK